MNTQQAKKLSLPDILAKLGLQPVKSAKGGNELWYLSPFRDEKDASFHTSYLNGQWIWNDFGDAGGNVLDFVMRHQNADLKAALYFLDGLFPSLPPYSKADTTQALLLPETVITQPKERQEGKTLILDRVTPLQAMTGYIRERAIDIQIAKNYLVEVFYRNADTNKTYYAVGIKNRAGGYEIRNPYFKSSIGDKDLSVIKGRVGGTVGVFEGFMDFLSYLTDLKVDRLEKDVIILNSASFEKHALELIKEQGYTKAHLFFDNDKTGNALTGRFIEHLEGVQVQPENHRYHPHKDYNEMLKSRGASLRK
jgi:DNA primase